MVEGLNYAHTNIVRAEMNSKKKKKRQWSHELGEMEDGSDAWM